MSFRQRIKDGLSGKYSGLSNGLSRINDYIFGLQRSCYYLIGGQSGSAKTTLADYFLINALEDAESKGIAVNVFYYSLEIDEISKKANWLSAIIYKKYDIIISPEKIKGLGQFRLSEDELRIVEDCVEDLDRLWSKINWVFETTNPTGIYKTIWSFMSKRGDFDYEDYKDEFGRDQKRIVRFINRNPEEYNIVLIDHLALMRLEGRDNKTFSLKENIDKMSEYMVNLRNIFSITGILIQQFNQGLSSTDRAKYKGVDLSPSQTDFKDTTTPYQDADVVLGIMSPFKMDMDSYIKYNIRAYIDPEQRFLLKDRFRALKVIKNRLSRDDIKIGLLFIGEAGTFQELPKPSEIKHDNVLLEKINKLTNR